MKRIVLLFIGASVFHPGFSQYQDTVSGQASLQRCVQFALAHQTNIRQSQIDQQIAESEIRSKLADWLPQLNLNANYQNNFQLQTSVFNNQPINIGTYNASGAYLGLNQTIFNRDVLLAANTAKDVRTFAKQQTINQTIQVVVNVSKAFYDVLLSRQQILLYDSDMVLLDRGLKDAYNQYKAGLVDKTDYQRATITLNNNKALRKSASEQLISKYALLKLYMSYPPDSALQLFYDSAALQREINSVDTLQTLDYNNRIEFQQLQTDRRLQQASLKYYRWGFLPSVSAFGEYNFNYVNDRLSKLYSNNYPNSYAGLSLSLPIFQGTKRLQQIRIAKLQIERLDYNYTSLKDSINTQYTLALATYKSNLNNYYLEKENLSLAKEVYDVIQLQYRAGIKTYLEVVTANNDLFSAQINLTNALYNVLINKIDVQQSLGTLTY